MKFKMAFFALGGLAAGLSGCWTVREPAASEVVVKALPQGKSVAVQVSGFDAAVTTLVPVYGYATVIGGHPWGGRHHHCYSTTMMTETFIPQTSNTAFFRDRASDALERCGCVLQTTAPEYRVEVKFAGPYGEDGDGWATAGWMFCTLFTTGFDAQNWDAKLKVYEVKTGKLVLFKDYTQRYEALVWGPIPFFSPAGSDKLSDGVMQSWCLTVLTDRAVADVMEFLRGRP